MIRFVIFTGVSKWPREIKRPQNSGPLAPGSPRDPKGRTPWEPNPGSPGDPMGGDPREPRDHRGSVWRQLGSPGTILEVFCDGVTFQEIQKNTKHRLFKWFP